jgi:septal ring factor EnvC (AmiA/AmiB activator)
MGEKQNAAAGASTPAPAAPPTFKLNLRRLESIQRLLQYGAALVLLVFLALIAYSAFQLRAINKDIDERQKLLKNANDDLEKKRKEIDELEGQIKLRNQALIAIDQGKAGTGQNTGTPQIPARIYIQIAREDQRQRAVDVARQLQARGYIVPDIENTGDNSPNDSQLRYYENNFVQKDIDDLTHFLDSIRIPLKPRPPLKNANARPRHYELWFGKNFQ